MRPPPVVTAGVVMPDVIVHLPFSHVHDGPGLEPGQVGADDDVDWVGDVVRPGGDGTRRAPERAAGAGEAMGACRTTTTRVAW